MGSVDAHGTADCQPVSRLLLAAIFACCPRSALHRRPQAPTPNNPPAVQSLRYPGEDSPLRAVPDSRGLQLQHLGGGGGLGSGVLASAPAR